VSGPTDAPALGFTGLIDLAAAALGGRVLGASDDFFAEAGNLILPGRGVFIAEKFTDRGKWMDGWESRRRRASSADHDWCVLALGVPGEAVVFDVDTNHFLGNHPPFASIEGLFAPEATTPGAAAAATIDELAGRTWTELLPQSPLRPGTQNLFAAAPRGPMSHLRLNIFPDGGVARLRVHGRVALPVGGGRPPDDPALRDAETQRRVPAGLLDLAAVKNGGLALACSDAFFGPMNNLLMPGRAENMGGGWETRRRRGPGSDRMSDWMLVQLGTRGVPEVIEIDTAHFKGNYPDRCALETIDAPAGTRITDLIQSPRWSAIVPETKLQPDDRRFFDLGAAAAPATHVRLQIFPDGGVSRLRLWGRRA
jgi:allantoicase